METITYSIDMFSTHISEPLIRLMNAIIGLVSETSSSSVSSIFLLDAGFESTSIHGIGRSVITLSTMYSVDREQLNLFVLYVLCDIFLQAQAQALHSTDSIERRYSDSFGLWHILHRGTA